MNKKIYFSLIALAFLSTGCEQKSDVTYKSANMTQEATSADDTQTDASVATQSDDTVDEVADTAKTTVEAVAEKTEEVTAPIVETAVATAATVKSAVTESVDTATETVSDVKEELSNEVEDAEEKVEQSVATVYEKGDPAKGQKLYLKKLKKRCGMNGAKFAAQHTQDEWDEIVENGKFAEEVQKICPDVTGFDEKWTSDIYGFCYEYASDSGNVPSC